MDTLRPKGSFDEPAENTTSHSTPPKSGVPPKRPSTNAQRTSYSTPTATTKQTTTSAPKSKRGSALSKPPTRPPAASLARRSANELPPPKSESRGHRQRNSISSVDSFTKGEPSASDENGKPSAGKRFVTRDRETPKSPTKSGVAPKARRSTLGPGLNRGPKNPPVRDDTKSPSKPASRPLLSGATSLADRTALRSGRPQVSSAKSILSSLAPAKKRLSTIPDSPSPAQNTPQQDLSQAKATRPGLGTRKSMTSVTIEQRLREMEAVHSMLRVAMADDGDEDDETKEEYGKKVDETLATLRARLEDARRSEGKIDLENTENASDDPSIATSNPSDQIDRTHRYGSSDLDQAKDRELSHQREVIESLQKEVLQLHESKDQELESVKIDLSQAHDATVLKLRQECEETISRHSEHTTAKLKNAEESYNALLKEQQGSNETQLRELRATVASLDETNAELRRSISDLQSAKIKEFESRLASSAEEIKELKSSQAEAGREADLVRERMATLEVERDQAQASKLAMDEALSRALDEGLSFKNALETLEKEGKDAALQHQVQLTQAKEEVTATSKALEENMRQSELSTTDHLAELQDLRNSHQTTIEEHAKKSQSDLAEWQSKYNTLLEETESAAKHHFDDIEALKSEKAHLITSKDLELEEIKMSHNKEIDALKERIQSHESQSWSDQETRKKLEEDMAIVQQRQETECRLTREECDATISQKAQEAEKLCEQAEESIQNLKSQLEVAEEAAKLNEQKYGQSTFELESARTEVQEAKLEAENLSIRLEEQTEAQKVLRDNLKAQLDTNSELTAQLQDSQATVKRLADEVCERESALKVTTAELMETKTKRSNGNSPSIKNRTAQTSVRTSLGTPGANCHRDGVEGHLIGEDLGSQTQAHMAGMQEQIRQMDRLNEEILAEQQSFYLKLVKAEEMPSLVSRSSYSGRESMTGQHLREAESSDGAVSHDYDESGESEL